MCLPTFHKSKCYKKRIVLVSRLCILGGGIVGIVVAIYEPPSIFGLAVFAFGTLGNSFLVPYVASVYSKKANYIGCLCAMIGGATTNIIWTAMELEAVTAVHPFLAGLTVSLLGMIIGSRFGKKPSQKVMDIFDKSTNKRFFSQKFDQNINRDLAPEAKNISEFLKTDVDNLGKSYS